MISQPLKMNFNRKAIDLASRTSDAEILLPLEDQVNHLTRWPVGTMVSTMHVVKNECDTLIL